MRRFLLLPCAIMLVSSAAFADTIHVSVNGLVCAFCATGLEKTFKKQDAVEGVKVDLESKLVTIDTKPGNDIDDATVTSLIEDAGFSVTKIERVK